MREWRIVFRVRMPHPMTNVVLLQMASAAHRVAGVLSQELGGDPRKTNDGVEVVAINDVTDATTATVDDEYALNMARGLVNHVRRRADGTGNRVTPYEEIITGEPWTCPNPACRVLNGNDVKIRDCWNCKHPRPGFNPANPQGV